MRIAILGATGFIGSHLTKYLLENRTDDEIVAIGKDTAKLDIQSDRLTKLDIDVFDEEKLAEALQNVDVLYYLIHMMAQRKMDFADAESMVASSVGKIVKENKIQKVIFLGGLGSDQDNLSKHLKSRHHTGEILKQYAPCVIEFRASMVIGNGSIAYEIIRNLVHKLPILTIPKWSKTLTQPIGLDDAMLYLTAALNLPLVNRVVEIGGPEAMSYRDLMQRYANHIHKKVFLIYLPIIPVGVSSWWLNLFTPKDQAKVGRAMVESLQNQMTVNSDAAKELFPQIKPKNIDDILV